MPKPPLTPLTTAEERDLAVALLNFFDGLNLHKRQQAAGVTGGIQPATLGDAWRDLPSDARFTQAKAYPMIIDAMAQQLVRAGLLQHCGWGAKGSPPLNACYHSMFGLTKHAKRGEAWLTQVLGWNHLLRVVGPQVGQIVGKNEKGDERSGSGLMLPTGQVVTNRHVVLDMAPERIIIGGKSFEIGKCLHHDRYDVALVYPAYPGGNLPLPDQGVSFRDHQSVEPVLLVGYPPIPFAQSVPLTAQTGETCGATIVDYDHCQQLLVSAIARPGNSGGPVFARDGRVVGIVTRSLERPREEADEMQPMPFFAVVPAENVRECVRDIDPEIDFPWETWEQ